MTTIITPRGTPEVSNTGASIVGMLVLLIITAAFIGLFLVYGMPMIQNMAQPQAKSPIDINVQLPTPTPDPIPTPPTTTTPVTTP